MAGRRRGRRAEESDGEEDGALVIIGKSLDDEDVLARAKAADKAAKAAKKAGLPPPDASEQTWNPIVGRNVFSILISVPVE